MNTLSTKTYRDKYRLANLDKLLRTALVAEKICMVDRTGLKTLQNPYGSQPTTVVQAIAGTYTPAAYTTTDDTLTVSDEFICAEHIYDFEDTLTVFDLFASRLDEQQFSVVAAIDTYVVNCLTAAAGTSYTTPTGGFSTASNVVKIFSDLLGLVAGYSDLYRGTYVVLENTDLTGLLIASATNGFSFADAALNNGYVTSFMGVDCYVVRSGMYKSATSGTQTWNNSGHRVFGVNQCATFAHPQGVKFEEKSVSGATGKEVVTYGYIGFKLWHTKANLTVNITLS